MDDVRCVEYGNPKDELEDSVSPSKGNYCRLILYCNVLCAVGRCLFEMCAYIDRVNLISR